MWLIAGVTVPEGKNRRKAILTFPGSFVKLTAEIKDGKNLSLLERFHLTVESN